MRWDRRRLLHAAVLLAWAAFFGYLWASGKQTEFIGRRTSWIVPFGTVALTVCGLARLAGARGRRASMPRVALGELSASAFFLTPILAVLMVPSPQLGANAANRKGALKAHLRSADLHQAANAPIGLQQIVGGNIDAATRRQVGARPGRAARVDGIVTKVGATSIDVTRFQIYCCAADALPFTVTVRQFRAGRHFKKNQWVTVDGDLVDTGGQIYAVDAWRIKVGAKPSDPYLE